MKKVICLFITTSLFTSLSLAQIPVHFGLKGGTYYAGFDGDGGSSDQSFGYLGGLFVRFDLPKNLVLQPEVYYSSKKGGADGKLEKGDVDIALLAGYRIIDKEIFNLRAMAGVYNSINVTDKLPDGFGSFEGNSLGYQAGIGVDITKITLDVRYEGSFDDVIPGIKFSGIQLAVGFKFI